MEKTVLICDDSPLMRRMVMEPLKSDGWQIVGEAENGEQAIEKYRELRPAAVTMDIVMPGADGLFGLAGIMQIDPTAKVVVVSALDQSKMISEAIRRGAQDFIAKPFLPDQLQKTLQACLPA